VDYSGGNDGIMYKAKGINNALNGVDGEQYTNTCMSTKIKGSVL
jgi:DNA transposition AAA+ family ATPase